MVVVLGILLEDPEHVEIWSEIRGVLHAPTRNPGFDDATWDVTWVGSWNENHDDAALLTLCEEEHTHTQPHTHTAAETTCMQVKLNTGVTTCKAKQTCCAGSDNLS